MADDRQAGAVVRIVVLGAGGLIGHALSLDLQRRGFAVTGQARRFTSAQRMALNAAIETPLLSLDDRALALLLDNADIVVNGIGVLQGTSSDAVHHRLVARLAAICAATGKLLIHLSVPGDARDDRTPFSRTKREGERAIAGSGADYVILRPGFVIALAAWPLRLPARESSAPFAATAISDLCETVARIAARRGAGEAGWRKSWDVMEETPGTVGDMIGIFRAHAGGPKPWLALPGWLLSPGTWAGDAVALLGWRPPVRSTAIAEMRRGVTGDPGPWMADTGIVPLSARQAVTALPATVQEKWFARLYLLKALALGMLVVFWCVSGAIALTAAFVPARAILLAHGFAFPLAQAVTIVSSMMDIAVGLLIAFRATARLGLAAGIAVSLGYMAGAAVLTPDLWFEPLGALVKTGPAIVLMLFCLALRDDR